MLELGVAELEAGRGLAEAQGLLEVLDALPPTSWSEGLKSAVEAAIPNPDVVGLIRRGLSRIDAIASMPRYDPAF
jgi:hypothetical protein